MTTVSGTKNEVDYYISTINRELSTDNGYKRKNCLAKSGKDTKLPLAKIYSEILEISSEVVRFSSELMQISSELVQISSEPVRTNLELLIISAFRKSATLVSETLVSLRNRTKRQRLCFSFIQNFVKTAQ